MSPRSTAEAIPDLDAIVPARLPYRQHGAAGAVLVPIYVQRVTASCVHLIPDTRPAGAENQVLNLLRGLREQRDLAPELVYFERGALHQSFEELDIPLHELGRRRRLATDARRRVRALRALYRERPPDILQTWLFEGNAVGLWAARAWPGTRVVVAQRSGTAERGLVAHMSLTRFLLRRADYAVSNSEEGADLLIDLGFDGGSIEVIPQGVSADRATPRRPREAVRAELDLPEDAPLLVAVGRADDTKDFSGLFKALELVRTKREDVALALVGPTPKDMRALGLELPRFVAAVGWQERPSDYMNAADLIVIPSWTEGHSNVAGEALMLGCPVVTTNTGAHVPIVTAAGGRVVPIRDPDALARAVLDLLDAPPSRESVVAAARPQLDNGRVVEAMVRIYERLLARNSTPGVMR